MTYRCSVCNNTDPNWYVNCQHPMCLDGRDQSHLPTPWKHCPNIMCEHARDCIADRVSWDETDRQPCYAKRPADPLELSKAVDAELSKMGLGPTGKPLGGKEISRRFKEEQNERYGKVGRKEGPAPDWTGHEVYRKALDDVAPIQTHTFGRANENDLHLGLSEELAREIPFRRPVLSWRYRLGMRLAMAAHHCLKLVDYVDSLHDADRRAAYFAIFCFLASAVIVAFLIHFF